MTYYYDTSYYTDTHPEDASKRFATREQAEAACREFCRGSGVEYDPKMVYEVDDEE